FFMGLVNDRFVYCYVCIHFLLSTFCRHSLLSSLYRSIFCIQLLALQIAPFNIFTILNRKLTSSRSNKTFCTLCTERTCTNDKYMFMLQLFLTRFTNRSE